MKIFLSSIVLVILINSSYGQSGKLVKTYDYKLSSFSENIVDFEFQRDGKLIVLETVGTSFHGRDMAIAKFNPAITIDYSLKGNTIFGNGTKNIRYSEEIEFYEAEEAIGIDIDNNDKMVIGGIIGQSGNFDMLFCRLDEFGTYDSTFHGDGKVIVDTKISNMKLIGFTVLNNNKILALTRSVEDNKTYRLYRLNQDGELDESFATSGYKNIIFDFTTDDVLQVLFKNESEDIFLLNSIKDLQFNRQIIKLDYNLKLDSTFSENGILDLEFQLDKIDLQSNQSIVACFTKSLGAPKTAFAAIRFDSFGVMDSTFGIEGTFSIEKNLINDCEYIKVGNNDAIYLGGTTSGQSGTKRDDSICVIVLHPNGKINTGIFNNGIKVHSINITENDYLDFLGFNINEDLFAFGNSSLANSAGRSMTISQYYTCNKSSNIYLDYDNDGFGSASYFLNLCDSTIIESFVFNNFDCDDRDTLINPLAIEIINNDSDENCDGIIEFTDLDNDGASIKVDCDDTNPNISPFLEEIINNEVDENCDGVILNDYDGDGFYNEDDCNDFDSLINYFGIDTTLNGVDENCDGVDGAVSSKDLNQNEIKFYPNPTTGVIYTFLNRNNFIYSIYNSKLQLLEKGLHYNSGIDLTNSGAGIYFIKIENNYYKVLKI